MTYFAFITQLIRCETNDLPTLPADSRVSAAVNAVGSYMWRKGFENTKTFPTNSPLIKKTHICDFSVFNDNFYKLNT